MDMREFEPECLKGLGVNWSGYTLPGGEGFQERFAEFIPELERCVKAAKGHIERITADYRRRVALAETLAGVRGGLDRLIDGAVLCNGAESIGKAMFELAHVSVDVDHDGYSSEVAEISSDIRFMTSLMEYVSADREVDMMLYGIYMVEPKYKAMVFRELSRAMRRVEAARTAVATSRSVVKKSTEATFGGLYDTLDKAYVLLIPHFRKLKRMVAEIGAANVFRDSGYQRLLHQEFEAQERMRKAV